MFSFARKGLKLNLVRSEFSSGPGCDRDLHGIGSNRFVHGCLHLTQWIAMSHKFTQWIHTHEARHLSHAGTVTGGLLAAYTQNPHALRAQLPMRADRDIAQIREVPGLDQQSAKAHHIECLWD